MCPHCRHGLAWYDLLPVVSWLSLKGQCRYCHKPISWQYPLVEMATATLFILSYAVWPYGWGIAGALQFALWLMALVGMIALVVYDLRWMLLPNRMVAVLCGLAGVHVMVRVGTGGFGELMAAFWGVVCIAGLFYALFTVSDGKWIGGGDVKLAVALGLMVGGPVNASMVIFLASLFGSIVGVPLVLLQNKGLKAKVPFGPFLMFATVTVYLYASTIVDWYKLHFIYI